jgi:hypothetical protein
MRRLAYRRYSEARAAHWLILIAADRVDATGAHLRSFLTLRPDNPFTESGVKAELSHHGVASRRRTRRADRIHQPLDALIVTGPWIASAVGAFLGVRALVHLARGRRG